MGCSRTINTNKSFSTCSSYARGLNWANLGKKPRLKFQIDDESRSDRLYRVSLVSIDYSESSYGDRVANVSVWVSEDSDHREVEISVDSYSYGFNWEQDVLNEIRERFGI